MPDNKDDAGQPSENEKVIIRSDPGKMTSELALNAIKNNNTLFANALLNELEEITHDGQR